MTIAEQNIRTDSFAAEEPQLLDLFLFTAGDRIFGVPADDVEGTAEGKSATPLPHAPAPVLGVVYARGRMLTVIDPRAIAGDDSATLMQLLPAIISLRGDEQLALAAESMVETITISSSDIESAPESTDKEPVSAIAGILRHGGKEIVILDPARLFDAAVQRRDRRRRRL
jgi:purine-binding chemotaxis protein CheW